MNAENSGAIHRVMHEIKRRKLQVLRVTDLTPRMRRITLGGSELAGFTSLGCDDHIKLLFARTPEEVAALQNGASGANSDGDSAKPAMRDYTPRRVDLTAGELDIDFVLHGDGPASTWATCAQPGQDLYIAGPRSSMIVPHIFDSYWLIGDETALPAIARRLEELPAGCTVQVVVEVEDLGEHQALHSAAQVQVTWVHRHERNVLDVVAQLQCPEGQLYAWIATEAALSRKLRRVLLDTHGLLESQVKAAGYWRLDEHDGA
ncbi:NADPH-dependent ferric-chelate reductase [compost metagenome]